MRHRGLTVVEVLVVIAIIGILFAIALPAIQMGREAARKSACGARLHQIGLALHSYQSANKVFPPNYVLGERLSGGVVGGPWNERVLLLPHVGAGNLYNSLNLGMSWMNASNSTVVRVSLELYLCPSEATPPRDGVGGAGGVAGSGVSSYKGCTGSGVYPAGPDVEILPASKRNFRATNGVFATSIGFKPSDIRDGLSNTVAMSEMVHGAELDLDESWLSLPVPTMGIVYALEIQPRTQRNVIQSCENLVLNGNVSGIVPHRAGPPWCVGNGYNHLFTPNNASCSAYGISHNMSPFTASSRHREGVNVLFTDGHVKLYTQDVDTHVWQALASKDGDESVSF